MMSFSIGFLLATCVPALSSAYSIHHGRASTWSPAGVGDVRAPCPMLNTLANHGFLPHSGKNITKQNTRDALGNALNINNDLSDFLFSEAVTTNADPNAGTFNLNDLSKHHVLEHDASLSRLDAYYGNNHDFNALVFAETRSHWPNAVISIQNAADALAARQRTSKATNPQYSLSYTEASFSLGETAAYLIILGNKTNGTVKKNVVEYLFQNERLPTDLGWTKSSVALTFDDLTNMIDRVASATGSSSSKGKRAGMHALGYGEQ